MVWCWCCINANTVLDALTQNFVVSIISVLFLEPFNAQRRINKTIWSVKLKSERKSGRCCCCSSHQQQWKVIKRTENHNHNIWCDAILFSDGLVVNLLCTLYVLRTLYTVVRGTVHGRRTLIRVFVYPISYCACIYASPGTNHQPPVSIVCLIAIYKRILICVCTTFSTYRQCLLSRDRFYSVISWNKFIFLDFEFACKQRAEELIVFLAKVSNILARARVCVCVWVTKEVFNYLLFFFLVPIVCLCMGVSFGVCN